MSELLYNTDHVAALYGVTIQTVRVWAMEFKGYLSQQANPGARRQRLFTPDDMAVFDLIAQLKELGKNFKEIDEALASGQRGGSPETPPSELEALIADNSHTELVTQNNALVRRVEALNAEIEQLRAYRDENIELRSKLTMVEQQLTEAKAQLTEMTTLNRLVGKLEGQLEELRRQIDKNR